jgi:hypothetical protein
MPMISENDNKYGDVFHPNKIETITTVKKTYRLPKYKLSIEFDLSKMLPSSGK